MPAYGVAQKGAQCGPSSPTQTQDPCEGPILAGRTTWSFLRHGLVGPAHKEAERSRQGTSRGARDTSHDDRNQAGARRVPACAVSLFPLWCKGGKHMPRHQAKVTVSNKTETSRTAGRRSSWSPGRRHRQSLWQPKTNFSQDKCTRRSPSKWPIVGALPAHYLGRGTGPPTINRTSHHRAKGSDPDCA